MEFSKKRGPALTSPRPVSRKSVNYRGYPEETCSDIHPARDDVPRIEPQLLGVESFSMGKFTPIRAVPDVVGVGVKRIGKVRLPVDMDRRALGDHSFQQYLHSIQLLEERVNQGNSLRRQIKSLNALSDQIGVVAVVTYISARPKSVLFLESR